MKRNLRRLHLQSGCTDRMHRPIPGLFEVLLDEDHLLEIMERASQNRSKTSSCGPIVVRFSGIPKAQADYVVQHPESVPLLHTATNVKNLGSGPETAPASADPHPARQAKS